MRVHFVECCVEVTSAMLLVSWLSQSIKRKTRQVWREMTWVHSCWRLVITTSFFLCAHNALIMCSGICWGYASITPLFGHNFMTALWLSSWALKSHRSRSEILLYLPLPLGSLHRPLSLRVFICKLCF